MPAGEELVAPCRVSRLLSSKSASNVVECRHIFRAVEGAVLACGGKGFLQVIRHKQMRIHARVADQMQFSKTTRNMHKCAHCANDSAVRLLSLARDV